LSIYRNPRSSSNVNNLTPLVYYDPDSGSSSEDEWYFYLDFSSIKVETDNFDSDADDIIDKDNQRARIRKERNKPFKVTCCYDKAGNAYLEEKAIKPNPCGCIVNASAVEFPLLQQFLDNNLDLFTWEKGPLGQTNFVKHRINTGDVLPIKQYLYWHSPAEKKIIQDEIRHMISTGIICP
ncbi:478_t:CDS:2, partial [Racocetra persica]